MITSKHCYVVDAAHDGFSVEDYLKDFYISRTIIYQLRRDNSLFTVNGCQVSTKEALHKGDRLELITTEEENDKIIASNLPLKVLYQDDEITVIDKPAGIPSHPSRAHYTNTVENAFKYRFGNKYNCHIITRLDAATSGIMLIANNRIAANILNRQHTQIIKTYLALVKGHTDNSGMIDEPIIRADKGLLRKVDPEGKPALTHFLLSSYNAEKDASMVLCSIETGRTHQIRVHMAHIGHPVLGDRLYNPGDRSLNRLALHCLAIRFHHPLTNQVIDLITEIPKELSEYIEY